MGQYFKIVNLDKQEYLVPNHFDVEAKLNSGWEDLNRALVYLLAQGFHPEYGWQREEHGCLGRWAGDRVVIIGDYDESGLYGQLKPPQYKNISEFVISYFLSEYPNVFPQWKIIGEPDVAFFNRDGQAADLTDPFQDE